MQISCPVQMLFPLEVRQVEPVPENPAVTQPAGDVKRPRREGAVTGTLRRRLVDLCWDDDNDLLEVNTGQGGSVTEFMQGGSATEFVRDIMELLHLN